MISSIPDPIQQSFNLYKETINSLSTDLVFWNHILESSAENKISKLVDSTRDLNQSVFTVYDIPHDSNNGRLWADTLIRNINSANIKQYKDEFLNWVLNQTITKSYNICELFLARCIQLKHFPEMTNPMDGDKTSFLTVMQGVKKMLELNGIKYETTNNKYIIDFISLTSLSFKYFIEQQIKIDDQTTWKMFFKLFSVLRNVVTHNNSVISANSKNLIKSVAKETFIQNFEIKTVNGIEKLWHKDKGNSGFIGLVNNFTINSAKFILDKNDLSFLDLQKSGGN